ncbi:ribosome biogenesis GTPase YqeH [Paenibacillus turpanensis]|uniref:ribosome biogenesis GTPase YqeH n=1 Tax=Paenibacillus turpanensis TaxID=2689078 RepID=UPI00140A1713|nr:ribosome biogenesis GTPase YqeH [Paenibacillus turpanensis]
MCEGCGVALQTEDKGKLGFIPASALERTPIVCQRCFRLKNYNEFQRTALDETHFLRLLSQIGETRSLVVHIADIFDFEGSIISGLQRFIGGNEVLLAVNKMDLLPQNVNRNRIVNWVQRQAKEMGLKIADVVLCSAKQSDGFERLIEKIQQLRKGRDVYVVGAANVGKSSLINRLIHDYSDLDAELTVSRYPGTTLDFVKIPLEDGKYIVDTPGILYRSRLTELVAPDVLKQLLPDKPLKPAVYQLNSGQTLFFGALARFDFVKGERQSFTCYVSNAINIHRTKTEKADELYAEHKGELLTPPTRDELEELPPLTRHSLRIRPGEQLDVSISGLGWISVNGTSGADVELYAPKGVRVVTRESLI